MKDISDLTFSAMPFDEEVTSASGLRTGAIPWALGMLTASVWLYVGTVGVSWVVVQGFGIGILLILGGALVVGVLKRPAEIARPVQVFSLGCIYFFVFDMALLRRVEEFFPETVLMAESVVAVFLIATLSTCCVVPRRRSPFSALLGQLEGNLSGDVYFWLAVLAFTLEYLRRLAFVGWSPSHLVDDLFLARSGGAFRRDVAGDWRVFLAPIEVFFFSVTFFVDRAWKQGVSKPKRFLLFVLAVFQLGTFVLDGNRGNLLIAITLPLFVRAAQKDLVVGRWLRRLAYVSFLLAPMMDTMVAVRYYGWAQGSRAERVSWNIIEAHRDDNFFWMVNLVDVLQRNGGVLAYKGPLGFIEGTQEVGWLWLISPIPRVFWPTKPLATEMGDETRDWNASNSIVGSLLASGGVTFVVFGGILFGIWLKLLEPLYFLPKSDGGAATYAFLLVITLSLIRSSAPWNTVPLLLTVLLIVVSWRTVTLLRRFSTDFVLHKRGLEGKNVERHTE